MTSDDEDLSTLTPGERLDRLTSEHSPTPQELERRERAAQRLKEYLLPSPFHQRGAAHEPGGEDAYWERLYESCVNL